MGGRLGRTSLPQGVSSRLDDDAVDILRHEAARMRGLGLEIGAISEVHLDEALRVLPPDGGDLHDAPYTDEMAGLPLRPALVRQASR